MIIRSQITTLRTALQHALDELHRVNTLHNCVRPDVTHAAMIALHETFIPEIEHASEVERRIVGKLVQDALAAGYSLSVFDGEEMTVVESHDPDEVYKALATTDSDHLYIHIRETNPPGVQLIWGNDVDVIVDYNISLETLLAGANALADELEGRSMNNPVIYQRDTATGDFNNPDNFKPAKEPAHPVCTATLTELIAEYTAWNAAEGLSLGSADEHLFDDSLTRAQQEWLMNFCHRWDDADAAERELNRMGA